MGVVFYLFIWKDESRKDDDEDSEGNVYCTSNRHQLEAMSYGYRKLRECYIVDNFMNNIQHATPFDNTCFPLTKSIIEKIMSDVAKNDCSSEGCYLHPNPEMQENILLALSNALYYANMGRDVYLCYDI